MIVNIVILYNNYMEVVNYGRMLSTQENSEKIILVVVVNSIDKFDYDTFLKLMSGIHIDYFVYSPGVNLGYLNGVFFGYNEFIKEKTSNNIASIVVSNTDIVIETPNLVAATLKILNNPEIAVIGPDIRVANTEFSENPVAYNRRKKSHIIFLILIFSNQLISHLYQKMSNIKRKRIVRKLESRSIVYEVHGCFMIFRDTFFKELMKRGFKPFLYSEESFIAEMALIKNSKIIYEPEIKVKHFEHSSTSLLKNKLRSKYFKESLIYILKEFY